ncbi:MAG: hypothetical protein ACOY0T_01720 [Myxococcota bacterium]
MQGSTRSPGLRLGPWLFGARLDLGLFAGASLFAFVLGLCANALDVTGLPDFAWLALVLAVDVAHVHATWFRTYLDRSELMRRPLRYVLVPLLVYTAGVYLYQHGALTFWRALAYLAVFHFVRQQVGWVALYRARSGTANSLDRLIDEAAVYASTLYPLFVWHVNASEKGFSWFVAGDFVALPLSGWLSAARLVWIAALAVFLAREAAKLVFERRVELGKVLVVASTAFAWYAGIVANDSDFMFTATNVIPHGVPYAWLLFSYTRERSRQAPGWLSGQVAAVGFTAFAAVLVALAFSEQLAWDRLVEHDREWLFGSGAVLSHAALVWVVPLLALPQGTHYLLDALLWRRAEARELPALRAALGLSVRENSVESQKLLGLEEAAK